MSAERLDDVQSLINLATGQGVGIYDPSGSTRILSDGRAYLDQNAQAFYRRSHKILRKLVETIPNQMTYRWGNLTLGGDDGDTKVKDELERWTKNIVTRTVYNQFTGLATAFNRAQIAANETGNAALVILVDDGQPDYEKPIALGKIKDIKGMFLADRWAIKPDLQGLNMTNMEAGITHYRLTGHRALNQLQLVASNGKPIETAGQKIHRSRVLWFRGEELSDYSLQMNQGCDDSVLEGVVQAFKEYHAGIRGAGRMLADFDFFVHRIEGLLDKMLGDGSGEFQQKMDKRLQANSLMRSAYRGMAIDLNKEDITTVSRSVAGYNDLLEQILSNFLSNTDLQPSELLQKYPSGLANTGQVEQQNCNDRTRLYQSKKFDSNIRDLLRIIFNWKDGPTKGKEPKVWDWEWNELFPTTPLEQSELELNWAQIDANRIQSGVYSADDAAKSHYSTPEFNPHITIDFKERERLKKEQEQLALAQAQQQGALPPGQDPNAVDPNAAPPSEEEDPLAGLTFDAADPLIAPQAVRDAAKKGLQIRRSLDSKAIPARVALLARKLDAGQHLSVVDVQAIASYHQRHRPPAKLDASAQTALYLLHGGPVGKVWADRALTPPKMDDRLDDDSPIKRTLDWKGFKIGLQYQPFDLRHEKLLPCGYGEIIGTVAADGMALDCYVGTQLESDRVFVVSQLKADTGEFDEHKLFIGFDDDAPTIKDLFVSLMGQERFGGIKEIRPQEVLEFTEDEREDAMSGVERHDEQQDSIHPAVAIGAGVAGVAALGAGAYLLNKQGGEKTGKPCGEGYISADYECHEGEGKLLSDHISSASGALTGEDFDAMVSQIQTTGMSKRIDGLHNFLSTQKTQVLFVTRKTTPNTVSKMIKDKDEEVRYIAKIAHQISRKDQEVDAELAGYTNRLANHVVVYTEKGQKSSRPLGDEAMGALVELDKQKIENWSISRFCDIVVKREDKNNSISPAIAMFHEAGHRVDIVHNISGTLTEKNHPISEYGKTNKDEAFAEGFALWMVHPPTLKKLDPDLHKKIEGAMKQYAD